MLMTRWRGGGGFEGCQIVCVCEERAFITSDSMQVFEPEQERGGGWLLSPAGGGFGGI